MPQMKLKILSKKQIQKNLFSKFVSKSKLRKKIIKIREKVNKNNIQIDFNHILKILKEERISKKMIGGYYPVNFEIDDLELLKKLESKGFIISLPVIKKNFQMDFYKWSFSDPLIINKKHEQIKNKEKISISNK